MCVFKISTIFLYLFLLLYANDMTVLAKCPEDLQRALDMLRIYCEFWNLDINVRKAKVMILSRGKIRKMPKFSFNEETVDEVVWDYKYLGVKFNYNNKFKKAQQLQFSLANRAMFLLLRKCRQFNLPLDIQLELFHIAPNPFVGLWNMGVREDGCNLKTTHSIFKSDRRQSYNPNMYSAWGSGKISDRNWNKMQDVRILVWFVQYLSLWIAGDF